MTHNLQRIASHFDSAVFVAEKRWTMLKHDKWNPRLLSRYTRSLRRCARLRSLLRKAMDAGKL